MANGDIIEYGAIEAITSSGTHDFYSVSTISHEPYDIVRLYSGKTDPQIDWVEYNYNNKKTYIAKSMRIHYISYSESVNVCNNSNSTYTYTIDGINYVLTLMPKEFWTGLPSSICTLLNTDTSKKFYTNSSFYTDSTDYYYSVYFNGSDFSYDSESIGVDTINETYTFVPVLVQDNGSDDVPDETIVKIGAITLDGALQTQQKSNEYINQYYSTNTMPEVSLVNTSDESKKWSWLKFTDGGIKKYICTSGIFLGCSYAGLIKSIKTVTIENTIYELRFPTYDEFVALAKANLLGKINNYMDNGHDSSYFVITSSGGYASFIIRSSTSSQINALEFGSYAADDFSQHHLVIPILVERDVPDGTIVEMGMTYDFNNGYNHTAGMETIYPVDGFTRVYDISEDVNIVRTLEIVDYNSSYTDEPPMDWVAYNYQNKLYYISRTTFIWGNIQDTFDICNNNKTIFLNGDYYKMTTMPIEFWTNLPSSVKNNMEITNLRMHTNSEVQVSIPNEGMQTGYRTVSFDTEAIKFVEDIPAVSGMQGEAGCAFIPVLTRIDIGPVKTVKMGILTDHEYRLPRKASKDNDWYLSSNTYRTNYEGCGFRFSSATQYEKDHDMEWEWIEITIDGTKMYISTTVSFLSYPVSHYYYDMEKYACIDGKFYLLKILTVQQWKSLPNSVLSKIDWKSSSGNYNLSTITSTEASSGGRCYANYDPSTKEWNTYGTYEITSESYIPDLGCIPVLQPITSGMVKMSTLITPESPWPIHFSDATSSRNYIFYDTVIDNTSYNPIGKWIITALNGKTILINTETIPDFNPADANSYNNKIVYFDGNKFKIRLLSKNEWESVPTNALNQISLFDGNHYVYTSTIENNLITCLNYNRDTGSFSYRTAELSTNTNPYELLFILEYIGPGPDNIKLGALVNSSGNIVAPKICSDQDFRYPDGSVFADEGLFNFSFTDTDNENLKWTWIKTQINGNTVLISKYVTGPCRYDTISEAELIGKTFVLENEEYQLIFLTPSEIDTLDYATLYNIDFGYGNSASWHMFTNSVSGNTIKSFSFCNDNAFGDLISEYYTEETDTNYGRSGYYATLKLISTPPTISGSDSNLGDKTQTFSVNYTVDDADKRDTLTITEKLNGTTVRTINNAVRNQSYSFSVTSSQFANLALYETSTIEIIVSDGKLSATRTYTFRKTNTAPVINYTGSDNLGIINSKPTIRYTVTDAEGDDITITERLNSKVLQTYTVSSGTECTVNIPNISWLGCGNSTNTIEINARDTAGGSSNKTITFTRAIDRIEVITNPIKTDKAVTKISLEVGWNTENASGQVFVCNNAYDTSPTWENMTNSVGSNLVYNLTNTTKTAAEWGVSVKVIVKKDGGSTGEVSLYSIKGTYE